MSSREKCALIFKCLYTAHTGTKKILPAVSTLTHFHTVFQSPFAFPASNIHLPCSLAVRMSMGNGARAEKQANTCVRAQPQPQR